VGDDQCHYTVQPGDSLSAIAAAHGLTLDQIISYNPQIPNPDMIHPGDIVNLCPPSPSPTPAPGPTPTPSPGPSPDFPVTQVLSRTAEEITS
jgi:LysM repeat protein